MVETHPSPMHIALVIEKFDPLSGGAERSTAQIAAHLLSRGHRVTVLCGEAWNRPSDPGLTVQTAPTGKARGVVRLLAFRKWARSRLASGDFDVSLSITTSVPATVLQPRAGLVVQGQDQNIARRESAAGRVFKRVLVETSLRQQTLRWIERRTLRDPMVRHVVAISGYVARDLERYYGVGGDRVTIIPNGSEITPLTDRQRELRRQRFRRMFDIPDDCVLYLFPAIDPWRKGLEPLLHAARLLERRGGVNFMLALAGSQGYRQQARVAALGLRDRVRILGNTTAMDVLFSAADVTVLPTYHDPSSKVVLESLMHGVPAISTAYNGASDFLHDGNGTVRGRVVADPSDVEALCQAMFELADADERRRCRAATVGLAERLTMKRHVDELERVLRDVATT